jgi:hypothetical protein
MEEVALVVPAEAPELEAAQVPVETPGRAEVLELEVVQVLEAVPEPEVAQVLEAVPELEVAQVLEVAPAGRVGAQEPAEAPAGRAEAQEAAE